MTSVAPPPAQQARPIGNLRPDVLFKALADPTRLRILNLLVGRELRECDLVHLLEVPQPTISRHLHYLERRGLVEIRQQGQYAHCSLASGTDDFHEAVVDCVHHCFPLDPALGAERDAAAARRYLRCCDPCE